MIMQLSALAYVNYYLNYLLIVLANWLSLCFHITVNCIETCTYKEKHAWNTHDVSFKASEHHNETIVPDYVLKVQ